MIARNFIKMNGAGNDFVMFDARNERLSLSPEQVRALCARDNPATKGCDQLVIIENNNFMRLYNADGSTTNACGNATRCVAWLLMEETKTDTVVIDSAAGKLHCTRAGDMRVTVDMGEPRLEWNEIPLASACDTNALPIEGAPSAVSMGNPHMIFVVDDAAAVALEKTGAALEHHPLYPERANVSFAEIIDASHVKLRVWERGAGATLACGTAACATLVALNRRNLLGRKAEIALLGGVLSVEWKADNHVWMTGPVELEFEGVVNV